MVDILGKALLDYQSGNYTQDILTATNISEEDLLPLPYLFRIYSEMPKIEQTALDLSKGSILDVGCGAGSHSLYLKERGLAITAIDISPGAVKVCKLRGLQNVICGSLMDITEAKYDTILLLMNGTGIFETVKKTPQHLKILRSLLQPNGQILIDSSDLQYMYDANPDGSIWVPSDRYYGELKFTMEYKGERSQTFPWLYLDEQLFEKLCSQSGFKLEIVERGENYDYLARLTVGENSPS